MGADLGVLAGLPENGLPVRADALELISGADAVIDFSTPAASLEMAGLCAQARIVHIIGTTGFSAEDEAALGAAARHATLVKSGNMSLGVNLLGALVRQAAPRWAKTGILKFSTCTTATRSMRRQERRCCWAKRPPRAAMSIWPRHATAARRHDRRAQGR